MGEEVSTQSSMNFSPEWTQLGMVARAGIEPATRGFSVPDWHPQHQLHQPVSRGARCNECPTMQDRAGPIYAKFPRVFR